MKKSNTIIACFMTLLLFFGGCTTDFLKDFKVMSKQGNDGRWGDGGTGESGIPSGGQELVNTVLEGNVRDQKSYIFTVPDGVKKMEIRTKETNSSEYNTADLFVKRGSSPTISLVPRYSWTADCASILPNREEEVCVFNSPAAGTWYVTLYGYNNYFKSRLIVTIIR